MKVLDNKFDKFGDDLKNEIEQGDKLYIASAVFSMYGYEELKKQLENIDELEFIFTNPTFIKEKKETKEERKFEIDALQRQKSIVGSEFEIKLKNKLNGRAIAKECANWIKQKARFKSNVNNNPIQRFLNINDTKTYLNVDEFSSAGLGYQKDNTIFNPVTKIDDNYEMTKYYLNNFKTLWNDSSLLNDVTSEVVEYISDLYKENSPEFIYYVILYNIFHEFLLDVSEDNLANERVGFKNSKIWNTLYDFQKDAALGIINKLETYNGCILADSVGLGKTFTALAVIKYYQERNKSVLVLCPKKLSDNWNTYRSNYKDNPLQEDRFNYDVLYHTDLSRKRGMSNGIDLSKVNWGNYDLVVIDESHNFRNNDARKTETRYSRLLNDVMKAGVRTKVLMLSATPVNNRFNDLKTQLALAYEGKTNIIDKNISKTKSIDTILKNAQKTFNDWSKLPIEERTSQRLLKELNADFDFFKLLDSVTIARSRKHIEKYYDMSQIGNFPIRLKPISRTTELTNITDFYSMEEIYNSLSRLNLCIYTPFEYILPNRIQKYEEMYDIKVKEGKSVFKQRDRERSLLILMRVNLLKRLESSQDSFKITLRKILENINSTINAINTFEKYGAGSTIDGNQYDEYSEDDDIENALEDDSTQIGKKVKIDLKDMNTIGWEENLQKDQAILNDLLEQFNRIKPENDLKLISLAKIIENKIENPINEDNKKVIIFSAFADTANYIYTNLAPIIKDKYDLESALVTGSGQNKCTLKTSTDFNELLSLFSPMSKRGKEVAEEMKIKGEKQIDLLIATDCISEGQNLQDCDFLINYDIHWNPVRIIQRFGRIDRIGSKNKVIQLVNFWPNMKLDDYINLKNRVEDRMALTDISATGEDNVLTNESNDMEYRKEQLQKLKDEVVDLEDMDTGVSITDLGLNDFRMDLLEYTKTNGNIDSVANGMHAVVKSDEINGINKGVIFVLKNINSNVNIKNTNQLHPFYIIYIGEDGSIISNHLNVKNTLDILRLICKGKSEPIKEAYEKFNQETNDGNDMNKYSELLNQSIDSIIHIKEESDIDSLFRRGGTTMLENDITGIDDFELIAFVAIV